MRETSNKRVAETHPDVRKDTGEQKLRAIAEKNWIGEEATLAILTPFDLSSTEDHGYHLHREAVCDLCITVRPGDMSVKRGNGKDWNKSEPRGRDRSCPEAMIRSSEWTWIHTGHRRMPPLPGLSKRRVRSLRKVLQTLDIPGTEALD